MSVSEMRHEYMAIRKRFQTLCGTTISSKTKIKNFIRCLKHRIKAQPYLKCLFAGRVSDIKNDIFQYHRDHEKFREIRGAVGTYTAYYTNRRRWFREHGDLKGWNGYMDSINVIPDDEFKKLETRIWRCAVENIVHLEKLWKDVEEAKRQHQAQPVQVNAVVALVVQHGAAGGD